MGFFDGVVVGAACAIVVMLLIVIGTDMVKRKNETEQFRRDAVNILSIPSRPGWFDVELSCGHVCAVLLGRQPMRIPYLVCHPCRQEAKKAQA
jgi:hypothetical protein